MMKTIYQYRKIAENICCPNIEDGCFAKGTLVHTKDGLRPIEKIQIGDYVLSSPEDGTGSPQYKRVLNTFVHSDKEIRKIYSYGDATTAAYVLAATGNHPFWVEGLGWTRADQLERDAVIRKADGSLGGIFNQYPIYRTDIAGVGWVQTLKVARTSYGTLFDYENFALVPRKDTVYLPEEIYESADPYLRVTVYNLEVEDFHTYYVGFDGIWVHNTSCLEGEQRDLTPEF